MKRIAVLIGNGQGRTLRSLLQAASHDVYKLGVVIGEKDAPGLSLTRQFGFPTADYGPGMGRMIREDALLQLLGEHKIDYVALCGYMKILSAHFLEELEPWTVVNLHPGLLPAFAGKDPQQQALDYGVAVVGSTVHFVTPGVDDGPIIAQAAVPLRMDGSENLESVTEKLREVSSRLYPEVLELLSSRRVRVREDEKGRIRVHVASLYGPSIHILATSEDVLGESLCGAAGEKDPVILESEIQDWPQHRICMNCFTAYHRGGAGRT